MIQLKSHLFHKACILKFKQNKAKKVYRILPNIYTILPEVA